MPNSANIIAPTTPRTAAINPPPMPGPMYANTVLLTGNRIIIKYILFNSSPLNL